MRVMLADRSYWQSSQFEPRYSVTKIIIIINVVVFVLQEITRYYHNSLYLKALSYLALSQNGLLSGCIWQLFTFQILHGDLLHVLMNCLVLYLFGRHLEPSLGRTTYLKIYVCSGVFGGLFQFCYTFLPLYGISTTVVGASAGVFGLVAAFAALYPDEPLMIFPIPVMIPAKWLLAISAGIALLFMIAPTDRIAHAAHLGGLLTGYIYIRYIYQTNFDWIKLFQSKSKAKPQKQELVGSPVSNRKVTYSPVPQQSVPRDEDFISKEVDPILDKISAHGIHSLTPRERQILEMARKKMEHRS